MVFASALKMSMTLAQAMAMATSPSINQEPAWSPAHQRISESFRFFCQEQWEAHRFRKVLGIPVRRDDSEIWTILMDKWNQLSFHEKENYASRHQKEIHDGK